MVFQPFLYQWIRNLAGQKVREEVIRAAQERVSAGAESSPPVPAQRNCDLGMVFALANESGGMEDRLGDAVRYRGHGFTAVVGDVKGRQVAILRSGAGPAAAAHATEALLTGHRPRWVVSAGFAGGLTDQVKRHDLVVADRLVDTAGQERQIPVPFDQTALAARRDIHVGGLLSTDRILRTVEEKRAAAESHRALAVDMETFAVAGVCLARRVPLLAVRVVLDPVDYRLPPYLDRMLRQESQVRQFGAALGAILDRPGAAKELLALRQHALAASDRLAKFLVSAVVALCPAEPGREGIADEG
jgi:adenosylhomocysteine nucleosidase